MLVLSIIESIYLFYMFHLCETSIDLGLTPTPTGYWFEHVVGNEKALRICPFGRIAILFLIAILLGRNATTAITPTYTHISLGIAFHTFLFKHECPNLSLTHIHPRRLTINHKQK